MNQSPTPTSFHPGQVVQLKSGGPRMTVFGESPLGFLNCGWFLEGMLQGNIFNPVTLVLATDDQPTPQQSSPLNSNTLCTSHFAPEDNNLLPQIAKELQVVVSSLTGLPINITWVRQVRTPDDETGWFEVSAPLKP